MEAQEILANIAFTTSGALVDLVDSMYSRHTFRLTLTRRKSDRRVAWWPETSWCPSLLWSIWYV